MAFKLLIVDDSMLIRNSLRRLLGRVQGISTIQEAATLAQALRMVLLDPPHLVILDLYLPDGMGTQIIAPLKQMSPSLLVAVMTIFSEESYRQQSMAFGSDWFFDKSTQVEDMLNLVDQLAKRAAGKHSNAARLRSPS